MNEEELRKKWMEFYDVNVLPTFVPKDRGIELPMNGIWIENGSDTDIYVYIIQSGVIDELRGNNEKV